MAILIRMPDALDAQVRDKAQSLGISINALLCVAADAYLRGSFQAPPEPSEPPPLVVAQTVPEVLTAPVLEIAPSKLSKAERREITRLQRLHRK
jgi:hypothetical protein